MSARKIRVVQWGTKHAHARGWLEVILANPDVELVGLIEEDSGRRQELEAEDGAPWAEVDWLGRAEAVLGDSHIDAVVVEGDNTENLAQAEAVIAAGHHLLLDKPAGHDYPRWKKVVDAAAKRQRHVQLGYMFRHHDGYERIAGWARDGMLGEVFAIHAHMPTYADPAPHKQMAEFTGGVFYDLCGHVLDQIVWMLGRPSRVTPFMQRVVPASGFVDNGVAVLEYPSAMAVVTISGLVVPPRPRRYEVYGTRGWAVMEPMEPAQTVRLSLDVTRDGFIAGEQVIPLEARPRYIASLEAFVRTLRREQEPDRSLEHERIVQETVLRATGAIE
jgi:predicted dehydrogenase